MRDNSSGTPTKRRGRRRLGLLLALATAVVGAVVFASPAMAAVTVDWGDDPFLHIYADSSDSITVGCNGGKLQVNGTTYDGSPAPDVDCDAVDELRVSGADGFANTIDLTDVNGTDFTDLGDVLAPAISSTALGTSRQRRRAATTRSPAARSLKS